MNEEEGGEEKKEGVRLSSILREQGFILSWGKNRFTKHSDLTCLHSIQ